jgi:hypothetical protein
VRRKCRNRRRLPFPHLRITGEFDVNATPWAMPHCTPMGPYSLDARRGAQISAHAAVADSVSLAELAIDCRKQACVVRRDAGRETLNHRSGPVDQKFLEVP